jgi:ferritin
MLKPSLEKALNDQINAEIYSAYMYLSMSAWFDDAGLPGMAKWMKAQYQEEMFHADKFFHYVQERGGRVLLRAIEAPPTEWESALDVFEKTLDHERHVTSLINDLASLSLDERDHATHNFLQWFIAEQVEEEATADELVNQLRMVGKSGHGMLMIDRELGVRSFTPPAQAE